MITYTFIFQRINYNKYISGSYTYVAVYTKGSMYYESLKRNNIGIHVPYIYKLIKILTGPIMSPKNILLSQPRQKNGWGRHSIFCISISGPQQCPFLANSNLGFFAQLYNVTFTPNGHKTAVGLFLSIWWHINLYVGTYRWPALFCHVTKILAFHCSNNNGEVSTSDM